MNLQNLHLPADAIEAIERNNLIEAIKATRAATGLGLSEAKSAVEAYMAANPSARKHSSANMGRQGPFAEQKRSDAAPGTGNLPADAVPSIARGNLIEAIRITRAKTGLGLKEAKHVVDAYVAANPGMRSTNRTERKSYALLVALIVLMVVAGIIGYMLLSGASS